MVRWRSDALAQIRRFLRHRRAALMISQQDLAAVMNTTQSGISGLETGRSGDPQLNTLARWAGQLGLDTEVHFVKQAEPSRRHVFVVVPQSREGIIGDDDGL